MNNRQNSDKIQSWTHTKNSIWDVQKVLGIMPESEKVNSTELLPW